MSEPAGGNNAGMRLRTLLVTALLAALLAPPAGAHARKILDAAIAELRSGESVFVHPDAVPALERSESEELRERMRANGGDVYVAILPADSLHELETAEAVLADIARNVRRRGTYAVVVGGQFRAGSARDLPRGRAGRLATAAFAEHSEDGLAATLLDFVDRVGSERGTAGAAAGDEREDEGAGGSGLGFFGAIAAAAAGVAGFFAWRNRRRRNAELAEVREVAAEDLVALGEDIRALDLDVELPAASVEGKADYARAVELYDQAARALERARKPEDLEAVSTALEEGRFAMASAQARLAGKPPPERRPPCFFDPRHGPSTRDVEWSPPGGEPRLVPACEADAIRIEEGVEPASREVLVGGERVPYWNASPAYGPWAGGFFGGATGGLLPALLVGSMLGSGLGLGLPGAAYGGGEADAGGGDFGGDYEDAGGLGGDFDVGGGGDFGGGDFGGGDMGGGDF